MEDQGDLNVNTSTFVIFLLILSGLGILWVVSCSWLTGRKKRQRVGLANNANVDDLVLQIARPMSSAKVKAPDRYSTTEQIIILPIDDLGQSLRVPTIVVTPPSPVGMFAEVSSLHSDGSIGSANDLLQNENNVGEIDEIDCGSMEHKLENEFSRGSHIRDSMRNTLENVSSTPSIASEDCAIIVREFLDLQKTHSSCCSQIQCETSKSTHDNNMECDRISAASPGRQNTSTPSAVVDESDIDDSFDLDQCAPRPRLSSMEPGTKKSDFQFSRLRRS